MRYPKPLYSSTNAPLIIFSAWCSFVLLMCNFLPSVGPQCFLEDWLTKSSQSKYVIAETVRVGLVNGIWILKFFPWQLITWWRLFDRFFFSFRPSSFFVLNVFSSSSGFGHSVNWDSSLVKLLCSCPCSCSALEILDSSSSSSSSVNN